MSIYPDGTGPNDPLAPWNQKDPEFIDCPKCHGFGWLPHIDSEDGKAECLKCNGTGLIELDPNDKDDEWFFKE
jgi:hypothetical protein